MRRMIAAFAVATAALTMSVPASAADPPTIVKFPKATFDLGNLNTGPAGRVCPFPVGVVVKGGPCPGHAILFDGQGVGYAGMGFGSFILSSRSRRMREREREQLGAGLARRQRPPGDRARTVDHLRADRPGWAALLPAASRDSCRCPYGVHGTPIAGIEEDLCDRVNLIPLSRRGPDRAAIAPARP